MPLISMRQLSRELGVTLKAVQDAVAYGRIKPDKTERHGTRSYYKFDLDQAREDWKNKTRPGRRATRRENGKGDQPTYKAGDKDDPPAIPRNDGTADSYHKARAAKEVFQAKIAKLDLETRQGALVKRADANSTFYAVGREIAKHMMNIPSRIAPILAPMTNILEIDEALTEEIRKALSVLSTTKLDYGSDDRQ